MTYQARGGSWIQVTHHHFGLTPDGFWPTRTVGRASNGLVTAADGVVVVSTGIHTGGVRVEAQAWPQAPAVDAAGWEDIGETSVDVPSGRLLMTSIDGSGLDAFPNLASAGPGGTYRVRVHARGRMRHYDGSQSRSDEEYLIQIWPAAPAPDAMIAINVAYARQTGRTGQPVTPFNPPRPPLPPTAPPGPQTQRPQPAPQRPWTGSRNETRRCALRADGSQRPPDPPGEDPLLHHHPSGNAADPTPGTGSPQPDRLPEPQLLLAGTDWKALRTPYGDGGSLPEALVRILDPDPVVRVAAVRAVIDRVDHQNTIYEATVPVARFVAAVLNHPATAMGEEDPRPGPPKHRPTRAVLLDWLGGTAFDADDECVAIGERHWDGAYLAGYPAMRAFRDLRPEFYRAVRPLLDDPDAAVREAAVTAAIPLTEHPGLADRRAGLADHVRRLLATSTDRSSRDRALDALKAWGHDTGPLETPDDIAARERYARLKAERENPTGGYTDDPPF